MRRVTGEDDAPVMPVGKDALLQGDEGAAGAALPQLAKDQGVRDGMVGKLLGQVLGILVRVVGALRPGEGLVHAEDEEEVGPIWLRERQQGTPRAVDDGDIPIAKLGDVGGHADQ